MTEFVIYDEQTGKIEKKLSCDLESALLNVETGEALLDLGEDESIVQLDTHLIQIPDLVPILKSEMPTITVSTASVGIDILIQPIPYGAEVWYPEGGEVDYIYDGNIIFNVNVAGEYIFNLFHPVYFDKAVIVNVT